MGPRPHIRLCANKTACLAPKAQVSMGPRHHQWICACMQNIVLSIRITSLNVSLPSSVVFAYKTATIGPELQVSMGRCPHLWCCAIKQRHYDHNQ